MATQAEIRCRRCLSSLLGNRVEEHDVKTSVLVLIWGSPLRILVGRKNCSRRDYWACDAVLPGGHVKSGESPVDAALREAWEEAWVHPFLVEVLGFLPVEYTRIGHISILPVVGWVRGPLCPMPRGGEIDRLAWIPVSEIVSRAGGVLHPRRRIVVYGRVLGTGALLWGATLRILKKLLLLLETCGCRM